MENLITQGSPEATALLEKADKLEAVEAILHGSAYQPVHLAVRVLRRLAQAITYPQVVEPEVVRLLTVELRRFANTVSQPASGRMTDVANTLEQLSQIAA